MATDMQVKQDDKKEMDYIDFDGHRRYLASRPSNGAMKLMLPNYEDSGMPIFDKKDWRPVNRRKIFTPDIIFDQNGHGSCVAQGWVAALMRSRVLRGYKLVKLSPGFFYSLINGGSDNGAVISDGIKAGQEAGTCLFSTVGQNPIYTRQMPANAKTEAQRFRIGRAFHCANWQQTVSAVQANLIIVYGYMVGNNFGKIDKDGVAGHDRGSGNHCNMSDGFQILPSGREVLDDVNSWATSFGDQGRVYLDEQHLFGGGDQADVCAIESIEEDPQEDGPPAFQA